MIKTNKEIDGAKVLLSLSNNWISSNSPVHCYSSAVPLPNPLLLSDAIKLKQRANLFQKNPLLYNLLRSKDVVKDKDQIIELYFSGRYKCIEDKEHYYQEQEHIAAFRRQMNMKQTPLSTQLVDYVFIAPEHLQSIEQRGSDNSLFLACARALLYKINFIVNKKQTNEQLQSTSDNNNNNFYKTKLTKTILKDVLDNSESTTFQFDSDLMMQELIRKKLCKYWLGFVRNGNFISSECKYKKEFKDVFNFVYQIYQLSINNFSQNRLFELFALEDLATCLQARILVFEAVNKNQSNNLMINKTEYDDCLTQIYQPTSQSTFSFEDKVEEFIMCDIILYKNNLNTIKYKWLMPKTLETFLNNSLLAFNYFADNKQNLMTKPNDDKEIEEEEEEEDNETTDNTVVYSNGINFFKINTPLYCTQRFLWENTQNYLNEYFKCETSGTSITTIYLFMHFLAECPVQTVISLQDLAFDSFSGSPLKMIQYLNSLWGKNHFNLNEIQNRKVIEANNDEEIIQEMVSPCKRRRQNAITAPVPLINNEKVEIIQEEEEEKEEEQSKRKKIITDFYKQKKIRRNFSEDEDTTRMKCLSGWRSNSCNSNSSSRSSSSSSSGSSNEDSTSTQQMNKILRSTIADVIVPNSSIDLKQNGFSTESKILNNKPHQAQSYHHRRSLNLCLSSLNSRNNKGIILLKE